MVYPEQARMACYLVHQEAPAEFSRYRLVSGARLERRAARKAARAERAFRRAVTAAARAQLAWSR